MPRKYRKTSEPESVALFHSTSAAIRAESVIKASGIQARLRPVPRHLSSDCGVCLSFHPSDTGKVTAVLHENGVSVDRLETVTAQVAARLNDT